MNEIILYYSLLFFNIILQCVGELGKDFFIGVRAGVYDLAAGRNPALMP